MMKIRLILPVCNSPQNGYCNDAWNISTRIHILNQAISYKNSDDDLSPNIIITSHNFFDISNNNCNNQLDIETIIQSLEDTLSRHIVIKKPLIIGFDITRGSNLNHYGGIDAVVCFLIVHQEKYKCHRYIWECWKAKNRCNVVKCFDRQNRYFNFNNFTFGLLSCGDMYAYCNKRKNRSYLQNVNIYVDLAHMSLPLSYTIKSIQKNLIHYAQYVIITQQLKSNQFNTYFNSNGTYKLFFSSNNAIVGNQNTIRIQQAIGNAIFYIYLVDITI